MFSLSLRERILVAAVLSAVVLGAAVKHWRDARRESLALLPPATAQTGPASHTLHYSLVRPRQGQHQP